MLEIWDRPIQLFLKVDLDNRTPSFEKIFFYLSKTIHF